MATSGMARIRTGEMDGSYTGTAIPTHGAGTATETACRIALTDTPTTHATTELSIRSAHEKSRPKAAFKFLHFMLAQGQRGN